VAEVARAAGFTHLSRFAIEYRGLFGELPSQALARRRGGR
jgi:AraC family ethanolamine operon transcriptional activator